MTPSALNALTDKLRACAAIQDRYRETYAQVYSRCSDDFETIGWAGGVAAAMRRCAELIERLVDGEQTDAVLSELDESIADMGAVIADLHALLDQRLKSADHDPVAA